MGIKRLTLILFITSLSVSALVAIFIFLFGHFGDTEAKILLTTLALGGFSLTTLCSAALLEKKKFFTFSILGMIVAVVGFLYVAVQIWNWNLDIFGSDNVWKWIGVFIVLTISFAHSSLLLLKSPMKKIQMTLLVATILFISIVAGMLIYLLFRTYPQHVDELFYRLLGTFAVLDVLGTIVTPISYRLSN